MRRGVGLNLEEEVWFAGQDLARSVFALHDTEVSADMLRILEFDQPEITHSLSFWNNCAPQGLGIALGYIVTDRIRELHDILTVNNSNYAGLCLYGGAYPPAIVRKHVT